jgi:GT2 family glycosyltransferase
LSDPLTHAGRPPIGPDVPSDYPVSIIIPLYGRSDLTARCLESIITNTPDDLYEVVLVDNASPDDTGELLDALDGDVTIIRNEENRGFAAACNQGAGAARGELLLFLNNDTEATPGWLPAFVRPLRREPGVGIVGARLVYPDRRIQHAGCLLVDNRDAGEIENHHRFRGEPEDGPGVLEPRDLNAVTGAALLIRREVFEAAGGFDEGYWNGHEDIDLCLRVKEAGWRIRYEPSALLVHHEGASGAERLTGMDANGARFAERWTGRFRPDLVHEAGRVFDPGPAIGPGHPEPRLASSVAPRGPAEPAGLAKTPSGVIPVADDAGRGRRGVTGCGDGRSRENAVARHAPGA